MYIIQMLIGRIQIMIDHISHNGRGYSKGQTHFYVIGMPERSYVRRIFGIDTLKPRSFFPFGNLLWCEQGPSFRLAGCHCVQWLYAKRSHSKYRPIFVKC
jgi:hypothetical protein